MKHNVLVFPCGTEIGLEIHRSLCFSTHFHIIGGSSANDHGKFVYQDYIGELPMVDDPDFVEKINAVVRARNIEFIFPAHDSVVLKLAKAEAAGNLACKVLTSPVATCEITRSKQKTYRHFKGVIPTPVVYATVADIPRDSMPVFLKPDVGQGSKGTHLARTKEEVNFYQGHDASLLLLEYLPGKEYTIDCFTNKDGVLSFCEGRERIRISNGISVSSVTIPDARFAEIAQKINKHLELRGVWFFQVKENDTGDFVLMEIAPRVAGTMGLVRCKGANLALLSLFDALGYVTDVFDNDVAMVVDRALQGRYRHNITYRHVYLDFDDVVILDGKANTLVMAFVWQCINKGVALHLLTRHKKQLDESLKKYRLEGIFDELIWLKNGESKAAHIKKKDAIFVDDSFAERKDVHETCGIPVFDSHAIEALIEIP